MQKSLYTQIKELMAVFRYRSDAGIGIELQEFLPDIRHVKKYTVGINEHDHYQITLEIENFSRHTAREAFTDLLHVIEYSGATTYVREMNEDNITYLLMSLMEDGGGSLMEIRFLPYMGERQPAGANVELAIFMTKEDFSLAHIFSLLESLLKKARIPIRIKEISVFDDWTYANQSNLPIESLHAEHDDIFREKFSRIYFIVNYTCRCTLLTSFEEGIVNLSCGLSINDLPSYDRDDKIDSIAPLYRKTVAILDEYMNKEPFQGRFLAATMGIEYTVQFSYDVMTMLQPGNGGAKWLLPVSVGAPLQLKNALKEEKANCVVFTHLADESGVYDLASRPKETLPLLIAILAGGEKTSWQDAMRVVRDIGYPANESAIPQVIDHMADGNSGAWQGACQVATEMGPDVLVPYLLDYLLDGGQNQWNWWPYCNEHLCQTLCSLDSSFALACAPTVIFLLSRSDLPVDFDRSSLLDVIEKIGPGASAYALPALLWIAQTERDNNLGKQAQALLKTYPQDIIGAYQRLLPIDPLP